MEYLGVDKGDASGCTPNGGSLTGLSILKPQDGRQILSRKRLRAKRNSYAQEEGKPTSFHEHP